MALVPSAAYPSQTDADANYPQGKARNAGSFQDGTGTPLEKNWVNDLWGFEQALLAAGGVTPSGTPDQVGASDYLTATKAVAAASAKLALNPVLLRLRQIGIETPFADTGASLAVRRQSNGPLMVMKSGVNGVHRMQEFDDKMLEVGSAASITSLITGLANNVARILAIGTGGNRCCFSTDFGANWVAGSDLGATPHRVIYNTPKARFMATFAAGVNVAQDVDGASVWSNVSSGLTSAQGGIAHFTNGDTLVCGYSGGSAVEMARSTDGGVIWAPTATVPNPSDYADSGTIEGNTNGAGGPTIYHAGRLTASPTTIRVCSTTSAMSWSLIATVVGFAIITGKPRILMCPQTFILVLVWPTASATQAAVSRDGGVTWSDPVFYQTRSIDSFGLAYGRLFSSSNGQLYATDSLA